MKTLILALLAAAALAVPGVASAHHGRDHHARHGFGIRLTALEHGVKLGFFANVGKHEGDTQSSSNAVFEKLVGTGASFGTGSAAASGTISGSPFEGGTYSAAVTTDWSKATTDSDGRSCAPATATVALTDVISSANTLGESATGQTCAVPANDRNVAYVFYGSSTVSSATGTASGATGTGRVLLVEKTDGTVRGYLFSGFNGAEEHSFVSLSAHDSSQSCGGDADGDGH